MKTEWIKGGKVLWEQPETKKALWANGLLPWLAKNI